jgi:cobalamin biosynthesis Mg chelatase CobN
VEIPPIFVNGFYGSPIILSATPAKIKPGENTTIVGTVGGINASQSVTIQYRKQGGNWSNLTTLNTNATGYFAYVWTPSETGVFEVKAVTVVEDISIESGTVTVTVEAPFDVMLYVYIAIVVIVVVVVIVIVLYMRRRGKKAEEELPPS